MNRPSDGPNGSEESTIIKSYFVLALADEFQRVFVVDMYAAVIHAAGVARQIGAAGLDDLGSISTKVDALDAVIAGQLRTTPPSPAPMTRISFGVFVHRHRHMGDHLVVDELVALGQHDVAVQRQHAAKLRRLKNIDALIIALLGVKLAVDPDAVLDIGGVKFRNHISIVKPPCQASTFRRRMSGSSGPVMLQPLALAYSI